MLHRGSNAAITGGVKVRIVCHFSGRNEMDTAPFTTEAWRRSCARFRRASPAQIRMYLTAVRSLGNDVLEECVNSNIGITDTT